MGHCRSAARFETFGGRKSASPGCCGARVLALGCHPLTIGLLQKMLNIGGCRCRLQVSTKRIVAKLTRNVFQSPEVIARAIEIRDGEIQNPKILSFQGRAAGFPHARV